MAYSFDPIQFYAQQTDYVQKLNDLVTGAASVGQQADDAESEVIAARDGAASLLAQINLLQASIGAMQTYLEGASSFDQDNPVDLDALGLNALSAALSTATDIVDVCIYDTRLDSDGGAWRQRCQHTSWYNETLSTSTRGSKREFPAVAAIVVEEDQIVIYDLTEVDFPMWMVLPAAGQSYGWYGTGTLSMTAVAAKNGQIVVTNTAVSNTTRGASDINFILDGFVRYGQDHTGPMPLLISERETGIGNSLDPTGYDLVSGQCNDVAITVLDDAPIDPATGLPKPTIYVTTDGGVSRIAADGTVSSTSTTRTVGAIGIENGVVCVEDAGTYPCFKSTDSALSGSGSYLTGLWNKYFHYGAGYPRVFGPVLNTVSGCGAYGFTSGLVQALFSLNGISGSNSDSALAYITKDYATSYMVGDTELCLAGDSLTDRSWSSTSVSGTATHAVVATGASLQATTATSDLTATVTTGGECYGWEQVSGVWYFRRAIADWTGVSEATGTLTIANGTVFTRLVYTNTTPSDNQLDAIEAADRPLFAAGAQHLLAGTSNSINHLAKDPVTDRLHVFTSYGRTTFQGLTQVETEATAVGTPVALAASDGVLVQAGSTGASASVPAKDLRDDLQRRSEKTHAPGDTEQFDSTVGASDTDVWLDPGWRPVAVYWSASGNLSLVAKDDYTYINDGFRRGIKFDSAPGAGTVGILAERYAQ